MHLVGAGDSAGPLKCYEFAGNSRKNRNFPRADRDVRPYRAFGIERSIVNEQERNQARLRKGDRFTCTI